MKRYLSLAAVLMLAGSMFAVSVDTADAHDGRRGALVAGLIIGGVTAGILANQVYAQPRVYAHPHRQQRVHVRHYQPQPVINQHVWQQHVSYCYGRYRSYNHHTNLFLAYSGQHRACRSPWVQ